MTQPEPPTRLRDTARAKAWLSNFDSGDKPAAKLLLDSIHIISSSTFRAETKELLVAARKKLKGRTAAYTVLQLPSATGSTFVSTENWKRDGSELIVQNILFKTKGRTQFQLDLSLNDLRERKIDNILFVADQAVSGYELYKFVQHFYDSPTIKSWNSSRHISIYIAVHTVNQGAWSWINLMPFVKEVFWHTAGHDFDSADWSDNELEAVENLCQKYADDLDQAYGYRQAQSLTFFAHTIGNGVPRILLQRKAGDGRKKWTPLLPADRGFGMESGDERRLGDYYPPDNRTRIIEKGVTKKKPKPLYLAEARAIGVVDQIQLVQPLALFLVAARRGYRHNLDLRRVTNMTQLRLAQVRSTAQRLGLINMDLTVTRKGQDFLRRLAKKAPPWFPALEPQLEEEDGAPRRVTPVMYYPRQLR
ncbi:MULTISPECIES: hypothetical protein [unclassified Rathayibacter]|uniref:phosphoribosyltransferase-like protein n=1 Tax=unclassified Rathayibacter TaxID=2609250 RepID=UPI0011B009C4|nr:MULTISPECIES: hypothetical protein [unclassified Rathayibacter]